MRREQLAAIVWGLCFVGIATSPLTGFLLGRLTA